MQQLRISKNQFTASNFSDDWWAVICPLTDGTQHNAITDLPLL